MKRLIFAILFPLLLGAQSGLTVNGIPNQAAVGRVATYDMRNFTSYYTMEEGIGATLIDHSGHGNNATQVGTVTWSADGGNTFANSSSNRWTLPAAVTPSTMRTFLIAVKYTWQGATHCQTSALLGTTGTVLFWVGYGYDVNSGTSCGLNLLISNGAGATFQTPGNGIHVIGVNLDTVTGANNAVYIDGRKESNPANINAFPGGNATMTLGANLYPGAQPFPGTIYSAAFGTTALTDAQMAQASQTMLDNLAARGVALNPPVNDTSSYVLFVGDSLTAGGGPNCCNGTTITDYVSPSQTVNVMGMGITGSTLVQMSEEIAGLAPRRSLGVYNIMVIWGGTNDCSAGATTAQALQSYAGAARTARASGWKVVVATMIDRSGPCGTTFKGPFNVLLRANWPQFADGLADLGADPNIGADGVNASATYFANDHLHMTAAGYSIAAGIFSTAINGLLSLTSAWLPNPGPTTLGGVQSKDCTSSGQFLQKINTDGTETCGTPAGVGGGDTITSPNTTLNVGGTTTNTTLDVNTALIQSLAQAQTASPNVAPGSFATGTFSTTMLPSPSAFVDSNGYPLEIRINSTNASTAAATVTIAGLGAKPILRPNGITPVRANDIPPKVSAPATYNSSANGGGGAFILWSVVGPGGPTVLTDGATVAWDASSEPVSLATLTFMVHSGSRTLTLTNLIAGGQYILKLIQDGTGGEGLVLGTGCTWQVLNNAVPATTVTLSSVANGVNVLAFYYDGTNCVANFH